ncbi:MAG TPA: ice-binding family protein [bacterium]
MKNLISRLIVMASLPVVFMVGCDRKISVASGPYSVPTATLTVTGTPTATATKTATRTATVTVSPSPTKTASLTATRTGTPIPTATATRTVTRTPTDTATTTATNTATATSTPSGLTGPAPVVLNSAANFAVLGSSALTDSAGVTICGYLGLDPGTSAGAIPYLGCAGDPAGPVSYISDPGGIALAAVGDLTTAYNDAASRTPALLGASGELSGLTLVPGVYNGAGLDIAGAGILYLDGTGYTNGGVFIFQTAGNLTTGVSSSIVLAGGALAKNVFWQVAGFSSLGATSIFKGTIMSYSYTALGHLAWLDGRAMSETSYVAMDDNTIIK